MNITEESKEKNKIVLCFIIGLLICSFCMLVYVKKNNVFFKTDKKEVGNSITRACLVDSVDVEKKEVVVIEKEAVIKDSADLKQKNSF